MKHTRDLLCNIQHTDPQTFRNHVNNVPIQILENVNNLIPV